MTFRSFEFPSGANKENLLFYAVHDDGVGVVADPGVHVLVEFNNNSRKSSVCICVQRDADD